MDPIQVYVICMAIWFSGKGKKSFMDSFPIYFIVDLNFKGRVCDKKDYLERDEARLPLPENHVATQITAHYSS